MSKKGMEKGPVGQWRGDGHFAGSSPSAPKTAGPLTGEEASGELASDVEPTGLEDDPRDRSAQQGQRSAGTDSVSGIGEHQGRGSSGHNDAGLGASPQVGKSSAPDGGHQEADSPGRPRPDKAQPREPGSSYGDVARDEATTERDEKSQ